MVVAAPQRIRRAVHELLARPEPGLPPPGAVIPLALALEPSWTPSVLCVGSPFPSAELELMRRRGFALHFAPDLAGAIQSMAETHWDAVLVTPAIEAETDGLRFVRMFKCLPLRAVPVELRALAQDYVPVPFLIAPLPGTTEFALFRSATAWQLTSIAEVSMASAILRTREN